MKQSGMLDCLQMPVSPSTPPITLQVIRIAIVAAVLHAFSDHGIGGDPHGALPPPPAPISDHAPPLPKVFVSQFRGGAAATTAHLVRKDLERSGAFEVVAFESTDAYGVHAEATGGWVNAVIFKPMGRVLFQRRYESPNLRQNVHRLTDDFTEIVTNRPGIASSIIGFVSDVGGDQQVYVCDSDGEDIRRVTRSPEMKAMHPCISLKNRKIVFTSIKKGFADIWTIDLETEKSRRLINAPGDNRYPALSPDGERLAVTMSYTGTTDLYVTTAQGARGRRLTNDDAIEAHPTWSPDGRHVAFERRHPNGDAQVCYVSSLGGEADPLPTLPTSTPSASHSTAPDWSPDGQAIAFAIENNGQSRIAVFNVTTRESAIVDNTQGGRSPSWAPDSHHLVYVNEKDLCVIDTRNPEPSVIATNFGNMSEPFWSR